MSEGFLCFFNSFQYNRRPIIFNLTSIVSSENNLGESVFPPMYSYEVYEAAPSQILLDNVTVFLRDLY